MSLSAVCLVICLLALIAASVLCAREVAMVRSWRREQAEWESFRRGHGDLDQALDQVWDHW
jgi:hypothetical protein